MPTCSPAMVSPITDPVKSTTTVMTTCRLPHEHCMLTCTEWQLHKITALSVQRVSNSPRQARKDNDDYDIYS